MSKSKQVFNEERERVDHKVEEYESGEYQRRLDDQAIRDYETIEQINQGYDY